MERDGPDLFTGISFEVHEIVICRNGLDAPTAALRESIIGRHVAGVKQAADEIAAISGQMRELAAHLASVIARHQNRRPR